MREISETCHPNLSDYFRKVLHGMFHERFHDVSRVYSVSNQPNIFSQVDNEARIVCDHGNCSKIYQGDDKLCPVVSTVGGCWYPCAER